MSSWIVIKVIHTIVNLRYF
ncbi:hypothetical protein F383_17346 [Gossypium arboreum]|uniref:Uncharacterized protein n=1 Tax=Gossypium arboreum TaxID=29729 RepID=A0A0B0NGM4_GOSAR|nr:hypothetical protein F383_17346 [Gossypium arboreum]